MFVPRTIVGVALLVFGRKAFWLFVAGVGFLAGLYVATQTIRFESGWWVFGVAAAGGLLGALLALVLQNVGVGLAGFLGGGYVAMTLVESLGWGQRLLADLPYRSWVVFIAGGILGAVLIGVLFEWALIILSSVIGATLIAQAIPLEGNRQGVLLVVLFAVGVLVQMILMRRERANRPAPFTRKPTMFR
jgi:hypothetical protein